MKRFGLAICVGLVGSLAASAQAAFPGRNGLLAVQPLSGTGLELVKADGTGERRVCPPASDGSWCRLVRPQWSPGGRWLVAFNRSDATDWVIYPDGSCLDSVCLGLHPGFDVGFDPAFMNDPAVLTTVGRDSGSLVESGIDGLAQEVLLSGSMSDPVWSSRGKLAVVRDGWIWVGAPHSLHRLARGSAPSWSPGGRQIVFARRGWLMVGKVRGRSLRRLVRGGSPAWSPDGKWIAFFDGSHRLSVVRASGGRVRRIGHVTGRTADWQPLPAKPPTGCATPPGSTVIASSDTAIVTLHTVEGPPGFLGSVEWVAMGCLPATGHETILTGGQSYGYVTLNVSEAATAGPYAALLVRNASGKGASMETSVDLFDLRTGCNLGAGCDTSVPEHGYEANSCPFTYTTHCEADHLVLGSDAVSAVHTTNFNDGCTCTIENIIASDSTGVHTLDTVNEPDGLPTALTNLTLTGDTLTWEHNGTPHSAQLVP